MGNSIKYSWKFKIINYILFFWNASYYFFYICSKMGEIRMFFKIKRLLLLMVSIKLYFNKVLILYFFFALLGFTWFLDIVNVTENEKID
jgi:hypothetical protein